MRKLHIDYETYSETDLKVCGIYKYASDPTFEILWVTYGFDDEPLKCVPMFGKKKLPDDLEEGILDPDTEKIAHNAQFERVVSGIYLRRILDPKQWRCTMVACASLGLPMSLRHASHALNLSVEKDTEGRKMINYWCKPCKPTKRNGMRTRNLPQHDPEKWKQFGRYNRQDVVVEKAIDKKLSVFKISYKEKRLWELDQRINDRGVKVHEELIKSAIFLYDNYKDKLLDEAARLTGLHNPNSLPQLKKWLSDEIDRGEWETLNKDDINQLLKDEDDPKVRRVLEIRQETSKSSIEKYTAMIGAMGYDGILRGLLQFYGARTGRWSGKIVQPQNLVRNNLKSLDVARGLVLDRDLELIELIYGSLSFVLSQLIRTAFIPGEGHKMISSDFAQIESRVLAWIADETWKLDTFRKGIDVYKSTGAKMFDMPAEQIIGEWRQKAKIGELACGYNGGEGAIARMWPKNIPLPSLEERKEIVGRWRAANQKIVRLWRNVQEAAIDCVDTGEVRSAGKCTFYMKGDVLFCKLPSGRSLAYVRPRLVEGMYGPQLIYHGVHPQTYQWKAIPTYGGKLVENIVQGIARDLLGEKMLALDDAGFKIVLHVHDETIIDVPDVLGKKALAKRVKEVDRIMSAPLEWAEGLPLNADTHDLSYYQKN